MFSELTLCLGAYFLLHVSSDASVNPGSQAPTQKGVPNSPGLVHLDPACPSLSQGLWLEEQRTLNGSSLESRVYQSLRQKQLLFSLPPCHPATSSHIHRNPLVTLLQWAVCWSLRWAGVGHKKIASS